MVAPHRPVDDGGADMSAEQKGTEQAFRPSAHDAAMLARCAEAVRNLQAQIGPGAQWADWIPQHLDVLAERIRNEVTDGD